MFQNINFVKLYLSICIKFMRPIVSIAGKTNAGKKKCKKVDEDINGYKSNPKEIPLTWSYL